MGGKELICRMGGMVGVRGPVEPHITPISTLQQHVLAEKHAQFWPTLRNFT